MLSLKIQLFGGRGSRSKIANNLMDSYNNHEHKTKSEIIEINAQTHSNLNDWEKDIRNNKYETMIVFDSKGVPIKAYVGSDHKTAFPGEEALKWSGYTLTHNHPSGGTFSPEDIYNFARYKLSESRVVTKNTTFIIKSTENANYRDLCIMITINKNKIESKIKEFYNDELNKYLSVPVEKREPFSVGHNKIISKINYMLFDYYSSMCSKTGFEYLEI